MITGERPGGRSASYPSDGLAPPRSTTDSGGDQEQQVISQYDLISSGHGVHHQRPDRIALSARAH